MKQFLVFAACLALLLPTTRGDAPPLPTREFRGAWVATVHNIDWPSRPGLPAGQQQAELRAILDRAVSLRLNAILLQVRPASDALYASRLEPWSGFLTGAMGSAPSPVYDPLAFAVKEAHARGLELHAWFNPFRAIASANAAVASNHITKTHPNWVRRYGSQVWVDPGDPSASKHVRNVILDVVRRYDVDGVHIDDYFYPYPVKDKAGRVLPFPDTATFGAYKSGGGSLALEDWRRDNINTFVRELYAGIKAEKRWVKFGISPFGIWRPRVPASIEAGLDSYAHLYADSRLWWNKGWCDYLSPQLYWSIAPAAQSFPVLLQWWSEQNASGRHLWPGVASDRIGAQRPAGEIVRQIDLVRQRSAGPRAPGHVHWNMKALMRNNGGIRESLAGSSYTDAALVPASPWLGSSTPETPTVSSDAQLVSWKHTGRNAPARWAVQTKRGGQWQTSVLPPGVTSLERSSAGEAVAVRAVDRLGNISEAAIVNF